MPVYEYQCQACGRDFEYQQRMTDPDKTTCELCGGALDRLISRTAFALKGGGWYKDLYASPKPTNGESTASAKAEGGDTKADKPAAKTEAASEKPAAKPPSSGGEGSSGGASGGTTSSGTGSSSGSIAKAS